ncbi:MAG: SIMPL domain-containing protein [Gammaproteobacteria bacterium]|nr:SIMPL domain-containing protein [Gammaproteobacteria bacterium]MCF6258918.1 SIMPL domain-containing protein [Gammaproteobacteria bacterium]
MPILRPPHFLLFLFFIMVSLLSAATMASEDNDTHYDRISLLATASDEIENDILETTLSVQREGNNPSELSEEVNTTIQWAITEAKKVSGVTVQTMGYQTNPVYQQRRLSAWRVRQSLRLESKDIAKLSQLIGKLQERLTVDRVGYRISVQRRNTVEENLITEAIALFQQRSKLVAKQMNRDRYRVVKMNINAGGAPMRPMMMRAEMSAMADTRIAPSFEAGVQTVTVSVNGTIELQLD